VLSKSGVAAKVKTKIADIDADVGGILDAVENRTLTPTPLPGERG
jgi:hypothetical protein